MAHVLKKIFRILQVLGDLYLEDKDGNVVNIIDELTLWPVFLERSVDDYIKSNFCSFYLTLIFFSVCKNTIPKKRVMKVEIAAEVCNDLGVWHSIFSAFLYVNDVKI